MSPTTEVGATTGTAMSTVKITSMNAATHTPLCNTSAVMLNLKQILYQDGVISAVEAWEYGNLTLPEFLKTDKDQNGFILPSEFDSDLAYYE